MRHRKEVGDSGQPMGGELKRNAGAPVCLAYRTEARRTRSDTARIVWIGRSSDIHRDQPAGFPSEGQLRLDVSTTAAGRELAPEILRLPRTIPVGSPEPDMILPYFGLSRDLRHRRIAVLTTEVPAGAAAAA